MAEEHFSLREMERRKRELNGKSSTDTPLSYLPVDKDDSVNLRHYLDVILHRKWIIIFVSMIVMLSALYKSYTAKPFYKAETQILLKEKSGGGMLSFAAGLGMGGAPGSTSIETLAVVSKTTPLLRKVVQKLPYSLSDADLVGMIEVKPDFDTNILNCIVTAPEEKMAVDIANTFAKTFIEYNIEIDRREANKAYEILTIQVEKTKHEMLDIEEKIKELIEREGVISIRAEISTKMSQMARLESNIRNLESQLVAKKVEITKIKEKLQKEDPTLVTETIATRPLQQQLIKLEMQLATTRTHRTDEHPEVIAIKKNIDSIKNLIKQKLEETVKIETVGRNPVRDNLLSRLSTTETTVAALSAKKEALLIIKEKLSKDMNKLPEKQLRFARLERQKKSIEKIYLQLQSRFQEGRLAKEMYVGNLHHLQPAEGAEKVEKNKRQAGILGLIVGLTIGIGLAFFLEYLDITIKTAKQVRELLGLNTIGMIPFFTEKERIINPKKHESIVSETFRLIQNNLRYTSYMYNHNIIMLASTQRGEGTTTLTINVGISAVMQGKSTLLIDCDLRRASLSKLFGAKGKRRKEKKKDQDSFEEQEKKQVFTAGLSDYLVDEAELKDVLRKTKMPNLFIIPAGTRVPNTAELLGSEKISKLFNTLKRQFDVIFIDTPAVLPIVDAPVLAHIANSIIFLVEYRKVPIEAAKQCLERLTQSNPNVIGCFINKMKWDKKHYYYYDKGEIEDAAFVTERRSWYRKFKEKLKWYSAAVSKL